ncbi:MAG TPA: 2-phosphosulfolactate phosphatase [Bacillales bacterium]|nr:2-phosphosulfolactate phosphatase [Bacillales bacterium]
MRKINVITQKELVDSLLIRDCTAVVIDVFLATSTITCLLENQFQTVYAVGDDKIALEIGKKQRSPFLLMGEVNGDEIENFEYPDPTFIKKENAQPTAIICSTNGTVAVERAKRAKRLYAGSLLNGHRVAEQISREGDDSSIILICSGNAGRFSMEDFVGAGHMIDNLIKNGNYSLSDSALLARDCFLHAKHMNFENLLNSETAGLLHRKGFDHTSRWVIDHFEKMTAVPFFERDCFIRKN